MEERMTLCNLTIEAGARAGIISPDETTFQYLYGLDFSPKEDHWQRAINFWKSLYTDHDAQFDRVVDIDITSLEPKVTWGTKPSQTVSISGTIPDPENFSGSEKTMIENDRCENR